MPDPLYLFPHAIHLSNQFGPGAVLQDRYSHVERVFDEHFSRVKFVLTVSLKIQRLQKFRWLVQRVVMIISWLIEGEINSRVLIDTLKTGAEMLLIEKKKKKEREKHLAVYTDIKSVVSALKSKNSRNS